MTGTYKVGFIGAGKMAQALGMGFLSSGEIEASDLMVSAPSITNLPLWKSKGVKTTHNNADIAENCKYVFLAVKPQLMSEALQSISGKISGDNIIITIASGLNISYYEKKVPDIRIIRVLPNTPCCVQSGVCAFTSGNNIELEEINFVKSLLSSVGLVIEVKENQMNAVCALSGSGPAFIFVLLDALSDAGVKMGLPRNIASQIASHMVCGAGKLAVVSDKSPTELKEDVSSPGGTTIYGIHELERLGFRNAAFAAVEAATKRGEEINKLFG